MSKRIYRVVSVNDVSMESLGQELGRGEKVIVAVDVAKFDNKAAIIQSGKVLRTLGWKAPAQSRQFIDLVSDLMRVGPVELVLESTGTYGDPLRAQMAEIGVPVFRVSTKQAHDAAEVFDGVPSMHDAKACQLLGWLHANGRSQHWAVRSDGERDLVAAAETYELHNAHLMACLSRIEAKLARHFPELTAVVDLDNASTLAMLEQFGSPARIAAQRGPVEKLLRGVGGTFLEADKPARVVEAARDTLGMSMTAGETETLRQLAMEANRQRQLKAAAKKTLEGYAAKDDPMRRAAAVIGVATAAIITAHAGSAQNFGSAAAYVKALGLNLKEKSSGEHKGQLKITKRGPALARRYLYLAVLRLLQREPHFKAWYLRKVDREGGKRKQKAVVALMRKLASALWHVARGQEFDPTKLFDVQRLGIAT